MAKVFLSDVDGTLIFNDVPYINEEDVKAIQSFQKEGNLFGLVTGRDRHFCIDLLAKYGIKPDCLITCNGAISYWGDEEIDSKTISNSESVEVYKKLIEYKEDTVSFYTARNGKNYFLMDYIDNYEEVKERLSDLGSFCDYDVIRYLEETKENCAKLSVYTKNEENNQKMLQIFKNLFNDLEVMATSFDYVEMTAKGCDKSRAMKKIIEAKSLSQDEIVFIGDGMNDVPLFKILSNTYVMRDAQDSVKIHAKEVVSSVAEAIYKERG